MGVGYDTTKEDKVPGGYRAQGVYDRAAAAKGEVSADEVKWRALYNGLETAQKDGYDLATVAGPAATTLTKKITHTPTGTTPLRPTSGRASPTSSAATRAARPIRPTRVQSPP